MDEGDHELDLPDEQMDDADPEKLQRESANLMRLADNCMFTIEITPGTTMHINIAPETGPVPVTWCISTLIIHNGQHYTNTIHNFTVNPELIHNLGLIQNPSRGNIMQQMLMNPLDWPRNPAHSAPRAPVAGYIQPAAIRRMVEHYCSYVMRTARILDNIFGWAGPQQGSDLPTLVREIRFTSQSLQAILDRVERSVHAAEHLFMPAMVHSSDEPDDEQLAGNEQTDEEVTSSFEDDTDGEADQCQCTPEFVRYDDYDDSQIMCDGDDSTSTDSDIRGSIFLGPDFEEFPQQFWSLTSSDDENEEEQGDEESWESDFEDDESFDAYMVRQLTAHATGLATRLNSEWVNLAHEPVRMDDDEWDIGSCGTNDEVEDIRSELSCSSEDLNAWQYTEDRSFETELSRPFRRLVGELPAQTAQEERRALRQSTDNLECRRSHRPHTQSADLEDESLPLSFQGHWRPQENLAVASDNVQNRRRNAPPDGGAYSFGMHGLMDSMDSMNESIQRNLSRLHSIALDDLEQVRDTTPEPDTESEPEEMEIEVEVEIDVDVDVEPAELSHDQQIVPLETFLRQTDDLIAQILASL